MDLILWRHADAEDGRADAERKLTAKGQKQAKRMAGWLRARLPKDAVVLVSPARRAQQTAQALTKTFETSDAVSTAATPESVLAAAGWPNGKGLVVVVGHQPTLGEVAALALTGRVAQWSVKKGAVWWLARREHDGDAAVLRAVMSPDLL
jgi:phosphohistidine phosphatase